MGYSRVRFFRYSFPNCVLGTSDLCLSLVNLQLVCWNTLNYMFTQYCASRVVRTWFRLTMLCLSKKNLKITILKCTFPLAVPGLLSLNCSLVSHPSAFMANRLKLYYQENVIYLFIMNFYGITSLLYQYSIIRRMLTAI